MSDDCVEKAKRMRRNDPQASGTGGIFACDIFTSSVWAQARACQRWNRFCATGNEVVLRVLRRTSRVPASERFTKEFAPLVTSGPPGIAGYASAGRKFGRCLLIGRRSFRRSWSSRQVEVRTAKEWGILIQFEGR